jgi:hypothetical protein
MIPLFCNTKPRTEVDLQKALSWHFGGLGNNTFKAIMASLR